MSTRTREELADEIERDLAYHDGQFVCRDAAARIIAALRSTEPSAEAASLAAWFEARQDQTVGVLVNAKMVPEIIAALRGIPKPPTEPSEAEVEAGAKALYESHAWAETEDGDAIRTFDDMTPDWQDVHRKMSRACIRAARAVQGGDHG